MYVFKDWGLGWGFGFYLLFGNLNILKLLINFFWRLFLLLEIKIMKKIWLKFNDI